MSKRSLKTNLRSVFPKETVNSKGYLSCFLDNVYANQMKEEHLEMFNHGSGGELDAKARAVHSSSMLCYNFFSWIDDNHPFIWKEVTYTKVYFEVQLRTLCCRSKPANMDIVLDGMKDGRRVLLFIESKFLEYTRSEKFNLPESYTKENYYVDFPLHEYAKKMMVLYTEMGTQRNNYYVGVKQGFCHLVALSALNNEKALNWFNCHNRELNIKDINGVDFLFANVIFTPSTIEYNSEKGKYDAYKELYYQFIENLPEYFIRPQWFSYTEIWKEMEPQLMKMNQNDRVEYLKLRYMDFAEKC